MKILNGINAEMETFKITDCIGDQTPTQQQIQDPNCSIYFVEPIISGSGLLISMALRRVICRNVKAYYSIDEILEDSFLLPANPGFSQEQLNMHIAADNRRGFGKAVEGYNIIAYSGKSNHDRPIASVNYNDTVRYYVNPNFSKMVKQL
jgi:hypothetical protein